jgi:hypothetical protein
MKYYRNINDGRMQYDLTFVIVNFLKSMPVMDENGCMCLDEVFLYYVI